MLSPDLISATVVTVPQELPDMLRLQGPVKVAAQD